jgi:plastocyanin
MRTLIGCLALLLPATLLAPARSAVVQTQQTETGTITGSVRYTGSVPEPMKLITQEGDTLALCDILIDPATKGLRHVAVLLEDAKPAARAGLKPVVMDQRGMMFAPRVLMIQAGQKVRFENSDMCNHCVKADAIKDANAFNTITGPSQHHEHVFEAQKSPVVVSCPLHGWMKAYIFVTPHPWACATDTAGRFRIEQVPPGKYTLLLVHPDTGHRERFTVEVVAGKATNLNVEWQKLK